MARALGALDAWFVVAGQAAAVGTDLAGIVRPVLGPSVAFLAYVLLLRVLVLRGVAPVASASQ